MIKGSERLHVKKRQVGEVLLLLSYVLVVDEWAIVLVNTRVMVKKCFKRGKIEYHIAEYKSKLLTCFNCGEPSNITTHYQKPKKAQSRGKVLL